jgi:membrane peptidoglycan carboxypeptidase
VAAFATFGNGWYRVAPTLIRRIEDSDGNVLWRAPAARHQVLDPGIAFLTLTMLEDVVNNGTATSIRGTGFWQPAAGKTGTTNDSRDVWFIGLTPDLVAGVWLGFDQPRRIMPGASGGPRAAAKMAALMAAAPPGPPAPPPGRRPPAPPPAAAHRPSLPPPRPMKKLTPVLFVEEIEPALPFWIDRLGFEKTAEVAEGDRLGFVILKRDAVEIMYQTRESVQNDIPELAGAPMRGTFLFIEVADLDAIARALEGITPVVPRRKTFYGADELIVREPAGNVVTFAQFGGEEGD